MKAWLLGATFALAVGCAPPSIAAVLNGDFETGDFSGWTQFGNTGFTSVSSGSPHTGTYAADFGPVGSTGGIFQTVSTTSGASYTVSFWLRNDGDLPNSYEASWGGVTFSALGNVSAFGYRLFSFPVVAVSSSTELRFTFQHDPSFWWLDDIS